MTPGGHVYDELTGIENLRFAAENLTDRSLERERWIYDGARSDGPLEYVETRTLRMGPYYSVRVRRSF